MKSYAIIGCGNGGKAIAAEFASKGKSVSLFEKIPNDDFRKLQESGKIKLTGTMTLTAQIELITDDMREAVEGRDMILVVVPAFAHESLFRELVPILKDGQDIVVVPGNYSTFIIRKLMKELGLKTQITVSETVSLPYACRAIGYNTVEIYKKKKVMKLGTSPVGSNMAVIAGLAEALDMFVPAENVLEIALDNPNLIVHPLPTLLNIAGIEANPKGWRHYIDGISPVISENIHLLDDERIAIGNAYGLKLVSVLESLKTYYGQNSCENLFDYVNSNQSPYKGIYGQNVFGRYVSEDLPFLAVPAKQLAEKAGLEVPWLKVLIELGSLVHKKDYETDGYNLAKLGIQDMELREIVDLVS